MKRFIKTLTVSRQSMFVVRHDSDRQHFEVIRWGADQDQPVTLATYGYRSVDVQNDDVRMSQAQESAVTNMTARFAAERDERRRSQEEKRTA